MRNIGELMAKAHKVQSQMTILQTKMAEQEFEGNSAGGAVTVVLTGKGNAVRVHVEKTALIVCWPNGAIWYNMRRN